jgi:hypothetical protein
MREVHSRGKLAARVIRTVPPQGVVACRMSAVEQAADDAAGGVDEGN